MPNIFNEKNLDFKKIIAPISDFAWSTSQDINEVVKSEDMSMDVRSLEPDKFTYPYHFHYNSEELFVIMSGEATLRTPDGYNKVYAGDIIFFEKGPTSAHQLYNHSDKPCMYLDIRTLANPDVCEYPDSGKINIIPGYGIFEKKDKRDYYLGEDKVREIWERENKD